MIARDTQNCSFILLKPLFLCFQNQLFQNTAWIIKITGLQILLSKKTVEPELRQIKEEALQLKRARGSLASCKSSYILHGK